MAVCHDLRILCTRAMQTTMAFVNHSCFFKVSKMSVCPRMAGNVFSFFDTRVIITVLTISYVTESNTFKRRIREAIEIRLRNPSLNRDNGFELARIYDTILAPLRSVYNLS